MTDFKDFKYSIKTDSQSSYSVGLVENYQFMRDTLRDRINTMARLYPDHVPYIFEQNDSLQMTYFELKNRVEAMARRLLRLDFKKGDRIAMQLPDTVELVISIFACAYIGVISVPIDSTRFAHELEHILLTAKPKGIILMTSFDGVNFLDNFRQLCPEMNDCKKGELISSKFSDLKHVILLKKLVGYQLDSDPNEDFSCMWDFEEICGNNLETDNSEIPDIDSHEPFIIFFTSGTTGPKKGTISTFYKFLNSANLFLPCLDKSNDWLKRSCNCLSFSFSALIVTGFLPVLLKHPLQIIFPSFRRNVLNTLRTIEKYKCRSLFAPPKFIFDLINHENFANYDTSSLMYIQTVGQILTRNTVKAAFEKFNLKFFANNYGMTEILRASVLIIRKDPTESANTGFDGNFSIGRALPFVELKVAALKSGDIVPFGKSGELCVRSFSTLNCYWNDVENTNKSIDSNGWFKTGDIVYMDQNGFVYYRNRLREVIRFQDADVFPSDIESYLRSHNNIADANVFSIDKNGYDEYLCAWIILKKMSHNKTPTLEEIGKLLNGRIHSNRKFFIKFVEDYPTGSTGKVLKRELSQIFKKELNL